MTAVTGMPMMSLPALPCPCPTACIHIISKELQQKPKTMFTNSPMWSDCHRMLTDCSAVLILTNTNPVNEKDCQSDSPFVNISVYGWSAAWSAPGPALSARLAGGVTGWAAGRLAGYTRLAGRHAEGTAGWTTGRPARWLTRRVADRTTDRVTGGGAGGLAVSTRTVAYVAVIVGHVRYLPFRCTAAGVLISHGYQPPHLLLHSMQLRMGRCGRRWGSQVNFVTKGLSGRMNA